MVTYDRNKHMYVFISLCIYIYTYLYFVYSAHSDSRQPLVLGVQLSKKRQEWSGTFLVVRGRPEEQEEHTTEQWMEVFITFVGTSWVHCGHRGRPGACSWRVHFSVASLDPVFVFCDARAFLWIWELWGRKGVAEGAPRRQMA